MFQAQKHVEMKPHEPFPKLYRSPNLIASLCLSLLIMSKGSRSFPNSNFDSFVDSRFPPYGKKAEFACPKPD